MKFMPQKETTKTYYVRDFPLHKDVFDLRGRKTRQTFRPTEKVDLTEVEFLRYQHLIETEEQVKSRQGGKK